MGSYRHFIGRYRQAFEHRGGVKALRVAEFEPDWFGQLRQECLEIAGASPASDVGASEHSTNWTRPDGAVQQFSLFNVSGRSDDYKSDFGRKDLAARKQLVFPEKTAIARLADLFGSDLRNMRLNLIGKKSSLKPHEEKSIISTGRAVHYVARFHVPIVTNESAQMLLDDELFHFAAGGLYFFHHGCVHGAMNGSDEERYHIVIDAFLSRALYRRLLDPDAAAPAGLVKSSEDQADLTSEPYRTEDFATEHGEILTDLGYGRRAPTLLSWYRERYPSAFRLVGLGESRA